LDNRFPKIFVFHFLVKVYVFSSILSLLGIADASIALPSLLQKVSIFNSQLNLHIAATTVGH
jgi:hypothetical protein